MISTGFAWTVQVDLELMEDVVREARQRGTADCADVQMCDDQHIYFLLDPQEEMLCESAPTKQMSATRCRQMQERRETYMQDVCQFLRR